MPLNITCLYCICYQRGYALVVKLCPALRREGLCQKQVALREAGIPVEIEGDFAEREG